MLETTGPRGSLPSTPTPPASRSRATPAAHAPRSLPDFLSPAPPRSEGEALLRRIFS